MVAADRARHDARRGSGKSYKEFMDSYERNLATNILADRLRKLEFHGIIEAESDPLDGRKLNYALTPKGIDLGPVMTEMVLWAGEHERVENLELIARMRRDKSRNFWQEIRGRWEQDRQPNANRDAENLRGRDFHQLIPRRGPPFALSDRPTRTSGTPLPQSAAKQFLKI